MTPLSFRGEKVATEKEILLTITMLVSNRIDTIGRCMDSIYPLLQRIPGELIVVDTGSTDGSVEVARRYADRIVPFTWCNDFAEARNAGLRLARGEWVMFLDDDEWFEDIEEITEFFESGEYKAYNRGVYLVRNYGDQEGSSWTQSNAARMVRRRPETKFIGRIHEYIGPQEGPSKYFSAYVHHYGYAFATQEERIRHSLRNLTLLEEETARCQEDVRLLAHLVQEYFAIGEMGRVQDVCRKVMEIYQPQDRNYAGYCYNISLRAFMGQKDWEGAYDWGKRLIGQGAPTKVALLGTIGEMISVCHKVGRYREGINCLKKYLDLYEAVRKGSAREEAFSDLSRYLQDGEKEYMYAEGIALAVLDGDYGQAESFFLMKDWKAVPLPLFKDTLDYVAELWAMTGYRREYTEVLDRVMKSAPCRGQIEEKLTEYARTDREAYGRLLRIFGAGEETSCMSRRYRFLYYAAAKRERALGTAGEKCSSTEPQETESGDRMEEELTRLWEEAENPLLWEGEMWETICQNNLHVWRIVERTSLDRWAAQVRGWLEAWLSAKDGFEAVSPEADTGIPESGYHADASIMQERTVRSGELLLGILPRKEAVSPHARFLDIKYREGMLRKKIQRMAQSGEPGGEQREQILKDIKLFDCQILDLYKTIYRLEILAEGRTEILPPEAAFAVCMDKALRVRQEGDLPTYLRQIAEAAKSYPGMGESCKVLLRIEEEENRNRITYAEQMEFILLAERMKHKVKVLNENGNCKMATDILRQLKNLLFYDSELNELADEAGVINEQEG